MTLAAHVRPPPRAVPDPADEHHRRALIEVLRAAQDEAEHLADMIRLLCQSPGIGRAQIEELLIEFRAARERIVTFETELRELDR